HLKAVERSLYIFHAESDPNRGRRNLRPRSSVGPSAAREAAVEADWRIDRDLLVVGARADVDALAGAFCGHQCGANGPERRGLRTERASRVSRSTVHEYAN